MAKTSSDYARERREKGLCGSCGEPALPGKTRCVKCTQRAKERYETQRASLPASPPKPKPAFDRKAYDHEQYRKAVEQGLCPVAGCNQPKSETSVYCPDHLERNRQALKDRRAIKKLNPDELAAHNAKLAKVQKAEAAQHRKAGLCTRCVQRPLYTRDLCRRCEANRLMREDGLSLYAARCQVGQCPVSGCDELRSEESVYCLAHLEQQRQTQHRRAERRATEKSQQETAIMHERIANAQCVDCGDPNAEFVLRCRRCEANRLEREEKIARYEARLRVGLCHHCDAHVVVGTVDCNACLSKKRESRRDRVNRGACVDCGQPNDRQGVGVRCTACTEQRKERRKQCVVEGKCTACERVLTDEEKDTGVMCDKCRANCRRKNRKKSIKLRAQVIAAYGGQCACCGESRPEFLQLDHIHNDGTVQHLKLFGRKQCSTMFYVWLRNQGFPQDRYQLLCTSCNFAKQVYGGLCPHQHTDLPPVPIYPAEPTEAALESYQQQLVTYLTALSQLKHHAHA